MLTYFAIVLLMTFPCLATEEVWVDAGNEAQAFKSKIIDEELVDMNFFQASEIQKRNIEHSYLMSKIEFWTKSKINSSDFKREMLELQKSHILSSSNRLAIFEFLKKRVDIDPSSFQFLCQFYSNDAYLRNSEPFFESGCDIKRISLKEVHSDYLKFDFVYIDGTKIDLAQSPYLYTAGGSHQFVFISNRYQTQEIQSTTKDLKKLATGVYPWVEGSCEHPEFKNMQISEPVRVFFSKDCIKKFVGADPATGSFLERNRYAVYTGVALLIAAAYLNSHYELGVTLP